MQEPKALGRRLSWARLVGRADAGGGASTADDAQQGYARVALELLARCEELHQHWLEQADEQRRTERLANAVAVYHWHLSGVRERLSNLEAPPALSALHESLLNALDAAYRATQLLSHGYRFHNVRRICDGGLLLEEARTQAAAARDNLARLGEAAPFGPTVSADGSPAS